VAPSYSGPTPGEEEKKEEIKELDGKKERIPNNKDWRSPIHISGYTTDSA